MSKAAFNKNKNFSPANLRKLRKKLKNRCIWSTALYDAEIWGVLKCGAGE
jgi:hypothetical protein